MAVKEQSLLSKQIAANTAATEESTENLVNLEEKLLSLYDEKGKRLHGNRKIGEETVAQIRRDTAATIQDDKKVIALKEKENKILKDNTLEIEGTLDIAGKIGDKIQKGVESIPFFGDFISEQLDLDTLGDRMKEDVMSNLKSAMEGGDVSKAFENPGEKLGKSINKNLLGPLEKMGPLGVKSAGMIRSAMKFAFGPVGLAIAAFAAIFTIVKKIRKANRKLANDLGIQTSEAMKFQLSLKVSEKAFNMIGLDGSKIKTTLGDIGKEFGSLENMTVANAMNIEKFAQNSGIAGSEVVKLNKVFMDLDGLSFDAATNVSKTAASLAKAAGVSTAKVIGDMASAAESFAEFSQDGAAGMAKAAVEAAKVGTNLGQILTAAGKLIDFETSITKQFEAQVLTGKMINTERARQLALDGDIAGLTSEIQSIVGGVGDIQSLNVIQRRSVADAIGISVQDLLKISRGEQVASQETVQDKLNLTNKLLATGNTKAADIYEATKSNKTVNMNQIIY